jgi:hypothetical protein
MNVQLRINRGERLDRLQVLVRILILALLAATGIAWGVVVYLLLPTVATLRLSSLGAERYLREDGPRLMKAGRVLLALSAFVLFLVDRFSLEPADEVIGYDAPVGGNPTVGSALLRLLTSLPATILLALLGCLANLTWLIAAVSALIWERVPAVVIHFHTILLRWEARLFAYHASLIPEFPGIELISPGNQPVGGGLLHDSR